MSRLSELSAVADLSVVRLGTMVPKRADAAWDEYWNTTKDSLGSAAEKIGGGDVSEGIRDVLKSNPEFLKTLLGGGGGALVGSMLGGKKGAVIGGSLGTLLTFLASLASQKGNPIGDKFRPKIDEVIGNVKEKVVGGLGEGGEALGAGIATGVEEKAPEVVDSLANSVLGWPRRKMEKEFPDIGRWYNREAEKLGSRRGAALEAKRTGLAHKPGMSGQTLSGIGTRLPEGIREMYGIDARKRLPQATSAPAQVSAGIKLPELGEPLFDVLRTSASEPLRKAVKEATRSATAGGVEGVGRSAVNFLLSKKDGSSPTRALARETAAGKVEGLAEGFSTAPSYLGKLLERRGLQAAADDPNDRDLASKLGTAIGRTTELFRRGPKAPVNRSKKMYQTDALLKRSPKAVSKKGESEEAVEAPADKASISDLVQRMRSSKDQDAWSALMKKTRDKMGILKNKIEEGGAVTDIEKSEHRLFAPILKRMDKETDEGVERRSDLHSVRQKAERRNKSMHREASRLQKYFMPHLGIPKFENGSLVKKPPKFTSTSPSSDVSKTSASEEGSNDLLGLIKEIYGVRSFFPGKAISKISAAEPVSRQLGSRPSQKDTGLTAPVQKPLGLAAILRRLNTKRVGIAKSVGNAAGTVVGNATEAVRPKQAHKPGQASLGGTFIRAGRLGTQLTAQAAARRLSKEKK